MEIDIKSFNEDVIDGASLRAKLGITNTALTAWRKKKGFPEPIGLRRHNKCLWRVSEVNAWIAKQCGGVNE